MNGRNTAGPRLARASSSPSARLRIQHEIEKATLQGGLFVCRFKCRRVAVPSMRQMSARITSDLNRRTGNISEGTKDTAVPRQRFQNSFAALTVIEKQAGVGWHLLTRDVPAFGTGDRGVNMNWQTSQSKVLSNSDFDALTELLRCQTIRQQPFCSCCLSAGQKLAHRDRLVICK